ncbi:MAG: hypothetical protein GTO22_00405, partial [Gemmatimonadales bacterium]|nr:hypothetical protein [Gemmatimonadales bacterium]
MKYPWEQIVSRARHHMLCARWPIMPNEAEEIAGRITEEIGCPKRIAELGLNDVLGEMATLGVMYCSGCGERVWCARTRQGFFMLMDLDRQEPDGLEDEQLFYYHAYPPPAHIRLRQYTDPGPFYIPHSVSCPARKRPHLMHTAPVLPFPPPE